MENGNLLDQALGGGLIEDASSASRSGGGRVLLIEDCVETSAAFVLHHLIKRTLSPPHSSAALIIFAAFAHPFSHYDRILRKMVLSLSLCVSICDFASLHFHFRLCERDSSNVVMALMGVNCQWI